MTCPWNESASKAHWTDYDSLVTPFLKHGAHAEKGSCGRHYYWPSPAIWCQNDPDVANRAPSNAVPNTIFSPVPAGCSETACAAAFVDPLLTGSGLSKRHSPVGGLCRGFGHRRF